MSRDAAVKWPGKAYDPEGDDLGVPLQQLLVDLHVLEKEGDKAGLFVTPLSLQVITSGSTALAKGWSSFVGLLGGGVAITAAATALGYDSAEVIEAAVFTASAGIVAAATAVSIAIIVRADVLARATASAAQYEARAAIASALLNSAQYNIPIPPTPPTREPNYMLRTNDDRWHAVERFSLGDAGVLAKVRGSDTPIPMAHMTAIIPTSSWVRADHASLRRPHDRRVSGRFRSSVR